MLAGDIGYRALPHQRQFHHSVAATKGIFGGNGSGKTYALARECLKLARVNRGCGVLFVEPTYRMALDIAVPMLRRVARESGVPILYAKSEHRIDFPWWGSWVWVRSADNPAALEGLTVGAVILDEAPLYRDGPEVFAATSARLRDSSARWLEMAVGGTFDGWDWTAPIFDERETPIPGDFEYVVAKTGDNIYNPSAYLDRLAANLPTEAHRLQRIEGKRVDLFRGAAYVSFDRTRHVAPVALPASGGRLCHSLDFNVDPACSIVGFRAGSRFCVADEIRIEGGATTHDVATEFVRRYGDWPGEILVHGDQTSERRDTRGTVSDYAILTDAYRAHFGRRFLGCDLPTTNPLEADRVATVNTRLRRDEIQIDPRCRWLLTDLSRVAWKKGARIIDKSSRELTHLSDALGYWVHRAAPVVLDLPSAARKIRGADVPRVRRAAL